MEWYQAFSILEATISIMSETPSVVGNQSFYGGSKAKNSEYSKIAIISWRNLLMRKLWYCEV